MLARQARLVALEPAEAHEAVVLPEAAAVKEVVDGDKRLASETRIPKRVHFAGRVQSCMVYTTMRTCCRCALKNRAFSPTRSPFCAGPSWTRATQAALKEVVPQTPDTAAEEMTRIGNKMTSILMVPSVQTATGMPETGVCVRACA